MNLLGNITIIYTLFKRFYDWVYYHMCDFVCKVLVGLNWFQNQFHELSSGSIYCLAFLI